MDKLDELVNSILQWWNEHKYDSEKIGEEEFNIYEEEPDYATLAKQMKNNRNKEKI